MIRHAYITADSIFTPLGFGTGLNYQSVFQQKSALKKYDGFGFFEHAFCAGIIENAELISGYTKLETLCIRVIDDVVIQSGIDFSSPENLLVIASTKGNIDLLGKDNFPENRVYLPAMAHKIAEYFHCKNEPVVISNACVSGVSALIFARCMIVSSKYKNICVCAADLFTEFVLSGFHSFNALDSNPCRPFDAGRQGINLGEAAAAILISAEENTSGKNTTEIISGFGSNDANHISGPSRSGDGLYTCVTKVLKDFEEEISFINAHGTATLYNDEMEAIAFQRAGCENVPVNSLKGYFGHTLGAAGLLETILSNRALHQNALIGSAGFAVSGVSAPINVISGPKKNTNHSFLKTASGFGGTNAAVLCKKC